MPSCLSRARCARCGAVCVVLLLLGQVWHKIACHIFVQTCSPIGLGRLALVFFNLDPMPTVDAEATRSAVVAAEQASGSNSQCTPIWGHGEPRWAILLASPKSGSTYVQQMLNSHPKIWFGRERILDAYRDCRVRAEGHCGWPETKARIEDVFMKYRNEFWYEGSMVVGFKVQYEHIAPELRPDFARWLECNQVDVLHLSRGAAVESFWTLQAEVLDSIQLKGEEKKLQVSGSSTSAKPHHLHSNRQPIPLDPAKASEYVRAVEARRADYRQLLLYGPARVAYLELHYETLVSGRPGLLEWEAALGFLGLHGVKSSKCRPSGVCGAESLHSDSVKVHPGGCKTKIANWAQVRESLKGTDTFVACESQSFSTSNGDDASVIRQDDGRRT